MNSLQAEFCISPSERLDEASRISVQEAVSNLISAFSDSKDVDTRCGAASDCVHNILKKTKVKKTKITQFLQLLNQENFAHTLIPELAVRSTTDGAAAAQVQSLRGSGSGAALARTTTTAATRAAAEEEERHLRPESARIRRNGTVNRLRKLSTIRSVIQMRTRSSRGRPSRPPIAPSTWTTGTTS